MRTDQPQCLTVPDPTRNPFRQPLLHHPLQCRLVNVQWNEFTHFPVTKEPNINCIFVLKKKKKCRLTDNLVHRVAVVLSRIALFPY